MKNILAAIALMLLPLGGVAALLNSPIAGVVVDSETGKPIAGAYVTVDWIHSGGDMVGSRTSCVHMELTRSDKEGRYQFATKSMPVGLNIEREIRAYVPGYQETEAYDERRIALRRFDGSGEERLSQLRGYWMMTQCVSDVDGYETLRPLYEQIDTELASLKFIDPRKFHPNAHVNKLNRQEESLRKGSNPR